MSPSFLRLVLRSVTAGFFLLAALILYLQHQEPRGWPTVAGRVEDVAVVTADGSGSGGPGERFVPAVAYTYEVGDTRYEARELSRFRWIYWNRDRAELFFRETGLYDGARVEVYYNPQDPAEAVLVRQFPWHRWEVRIAFLVLVILPLGVVGFSVRDFLRGGESRRGDRSRGRFW